MKKILSLTIFSFIIFISINIDSAKAIDNGTYKIVSMLDENMVLTSNEENNVQLNSYKGENNLYFIQVTYRYNNL